MATSLFRPLLLNNGHTMPRLGLGTFLLKGDQCQEVVARALELGYRHVDSAYSYKNETDIGITVGRCIKKGLVKREDIFITTKIPPIYLGYSRDVMSCVEESLDNLQCKYVDLVLVHQPWGLKNSGDGNLRPIGTDGVTLDFVDYDLCATWSAMEDCVRSGKVKSIGLSNCKESIIRKIWNSCRIKPQNLQFEYHAYNQQTRLLQLCDELGIAATGYSPMGAPARELHHHTEANKHVRLLDDQTVAQIASKYNKTPAQVLIRFLLQQNMATVPKASSDSRLVENLSVFDFEISGDDMSTLRILDRGLRYFVFPHFKKHPEFPKDNEPF